MPSFLAFLRSRSGPDIEGLSFTRAKTGPLHPRNYRLVKSLRPYAVQPTIWTASLDDPDADIPCMTEPDEFYPYLAVSNRSSWSMNDSVDSLDLVVPLVSIGEPEDWVLLEPAEEVKAWATEPIVEGVLVHGEE